MNASFVVTRHPTPPSPQTAVCIGTFDGVHLGHQALIKQTVAVAKANGLVPTVMTFAPPPRFIVRPNQPFEIIQPLQNRLRCIAELGIAQIWVQRFSTRLASVEPEAFIHDYLVSKLNAQCIIVGPGFHFGHRGAGDAALLRARAPQYGYDVEAIAPVLMDGERLSSTKVRQLLANGQIEEAARWLGKGVTLSGRWRAMGQDPQASTGFYGLMRLRYPSAIKGFFEAQMTWRDNGVVHQAQAEVVIDRHQPKQVWIATSTQPSHSVTVALTKQLGDAREADWAQRLSIATRLVKEDSHD